MPDADDPSLDTETDDRRKDDVSDNPPTDAGHSDANTQTQRNC